MDNSGSENQLEKKSFWLVIAFSFLIFFAQTKDFKLLFDGLTYVSISKNILSFNDWKTLHYDPVYYQNFYQHPPFAMWLQATVFKIFGFSEPISRVLSSSLSLLSVVVVFLFSKRLFGLPAAVWSAVVLFTSTRFIKWSTNFYLDGILGFFVLLSACLWFYSISPKVKESKSSYFLSFISGVSIAFALMTKGVVGLGALLIIPASVLLFARASNVLKLFLFFAGVLLPFLFWIYFGNGGAFIEQYFRVSVTGRTNLHTLSVHPWRNLYTSWIPWWPLFLFSFVFSLRSIFKGSFDYQVRVLFVLMFIALSFPIGFSFGASYLEHYLTPFYPIASIVSGYGLSRISYFSKITENGLNKAFLFLFVITLFIATVAPSFHVVKETAPIKWMNELNSFPDSEKAKIKQIAFSEIAFERWYGIAAIQGKSNLMAIAGLDPLKPSIDQTLMITLNDQKVDPSWILVKCFYVDGFRAYTSEKTALCERY